MGESKSARAAAMAETVTVHGAPVGEIPADDLKVFAGGVPVFTYQTRVSTQPFNVTIEGIILRDPSPWTVVPAGCRHVHIRNVRLCDPGAVCRVSCGCCISRRSAQ